MSSGLELKFALQGNLRAWAEGNVDAILGGLAAAMREEVKRVERGLEDETAILGTMAKGWTHELHPLSGRAYEPAATIWHPQEHIIDAHSIGADIRAKKGRYLFVPVKGGPADKRFGSGKSPVREMNYAFHNVRMIVNRHGRKMLVGDTFGSKMISGAKLKKKDFPAAYNDGRITDGAATIILFWVVENVRLQKIMDWRTRAEQESRGFAGRVDRNLQARMDAFARNPNGLDHVIVAKL